MFLSFLLLLSSFASAAPRTAIQNNEIQYSTFNFVLANTHSGNETHSGIETHSGAETHSNAETHSGNETFTSAYFTAGDIYGFTFSSKTLSGTFSTVSNASVVPPCISTLTWPSNGHRAEVGLTGSIKVPATGATIFIGYLLDGNLVNGQTKSIGKVSMDTGGNNADGHNISFVDHIAAQTVANHTVCLFFGDTSSGNTVTYPQVNSTLDIWVKEVGTQY